MSFILDALKKSESERQRQSGPSLATVRTRSPRGTAVPWIGIIAVLLALNLIVVGGFLMWPDDDPPAPPEKRPLVTKPPARPAPAASVPASSPEPRSPASDTLTARAESPVPGASPPRPQVRSLAEESEKGRPSPPVTPPPAPAQPAVQRAPVTRQDLPEPPVPAVLPTLTELTLDGRLSLPTLHVDIHVYSAKPESRFVFINNRKYREGEQLSEGPYVEEISGEGVILNHRGQRFLLPRD